MRLRMGILPLAAVTLLSATAALAQLTTTTSVEQLDGPAASLAVPQIGTAPSAPATAQQVGTRSPGTAIPGVPQTLVDQCEEATQRGTRPAPICASVLQAPPPRISAEAALLSSSARGSGLSALTERSGLPDADAVARRLGSGNVTNDQVAQAVGAGLQSGGAQPAPPPSGGD